METINELSQAVENVVMIANKLGNEVNSEIFTKAPLIIHQRLCSYLVDVAKQNQYTVLYDIPKAVDIMKAIEIIEELYPQLKSGSAKV